MENERIAVIGAGSWGTALALVIARNRHPVTLWASTARDPGFVRALQRDRCNRRYLPDHPFPQNLEVSDDLRAVAASCRDFLVALPSHGFAEAVRGIAEAIGADADGGPAMTLAWGTKGLEPQSGRLLDRVAAGIAPDWRRAVLSGPSFAGETAAGLPTALSVASEHPETADRVAAWLRSNHLRVYTSSDITGVQLGGVIKNVMAIAAGICDGLELGANARAALMTRGLAELARFGEALGGERETLYGLSGVGDLILSCTDDQSRNRRVGLGLARGLALPDVLRELGQEAEGVGTVRTLYPLLNDLGVQMPITEQVYKVLFEGRAPRAAVQSLLSRDPASE